jgi:arsenate reductase
MKILVMCVANSARSQLAEGLARVVFPDAEIASAGSNPGMLNPYAVGVMKEIGIDISGQYSKSVSELQPEFISQLDYVITLCDEEVCPMLISRAKKIHWPHPDPVSNEPLSESEILERFRQARDSILSRLKSFEQEILP